MKLDRRRAAAVALGVLAAVSLATTSCARERARRDDSFVALRRLGESTASPGSDPDRPVARSVDTQEVSAEIRRLPAGPPPAPAPAAPAPGEPAALPPEPEPTPPEPTPPADTGSPGVFAPPPPPPE
jgi:hypothetical protein